MTQVWGWKHAKNIKKGDLIVSPNNAAIICEIAAVRVDADGSILADRYGDVYKRLVDITYRFFPDQHVPVVKSGAKHFDMLDTKEILGGCLDDDMSSIQLFGTKCARNLKPGDLISKHGLIGYYAYEVASVDIYAHLVYVRCYIDAERAFTDDGKEYHINKPILVAISGVKHLDQIRPYDLDIKGGSLNG